VPLEALGDLVDDGCSVAIGGGWFSNHPMAAVRQLVRSGRRGLHAYTVVGSVDVDLLVGAGVLGHLSFSMVTLEAFGLAPNVRRAIESGRLPFTELTGLGLLVGLEAQGRGVPFLPYRGPFGSDIPARYPDIHLALVHLGGTRILGITLTMDGVQGVEALRVIRPAHAIPIHVDDYTVFKSPLADFQAAYAASGLITTMHYLERGETFQFDPTGLHR